MNIMNISGNYNTTEREIEIVNKLLSDADISFYSIEKSNNADNEDIVVKNTKNHAHIAIEVKEENKTRIQKYNDLGIDFISAFHFLNSTYESKWKGSPKDPFLLDLFESEIEVIKYGKIFYSKADLWLFYSIGENGIIFSEWYFGKDMTSSLFIDYLRKNCKFAVNNKPISQHSYADKHQSATFFINRSNPYLLTLKQKITNIF